MATTPTQLSAFSFQLNDISNVVYGGMGGSALAGYLSETWPGYSLPFEVVRQYHIPKYVDKNTLFIGCSYSGNTEEALSMLAEAEAAGAQIVLIASGGNLEAIAKAKGYPIILIPPHMQPRHCTLYNLKAITTILIATSLLDKSKTAAELAKAADFLKESVQPWLPTVPSDKNPAKHLAMELAGKSPVIYAGPLLSPAAYKWKINFNENAKNVAWSNELSEFNHNEMIGWSSHPVDKPYGIVELRSKLEHPKIQKRFEVGEKLLSGRRPAPNVVDVQGSTLLEQLLWSVAYGDFVSIYLALLNNVNPTPVDLVEKFKKSLNE